MVKAEMDLRSSYHLHYLLYSGEVNVMDSNSPFLINKITFLT